MGGNPLKKLHQTLLAKEKSRKDGFRKLANRLMFWKKDESKMKKEDEASLTNEDVQSLQSKRQVSISLRIIRIAYDEISICNIEMPIKTNQYFSENLHQKTKSQLNKTVRYLQGVLKR